MKNTELKQTFQSFIPSASSLELELTAEWERIIKVKPISWKGFLQGKARRAAKRNPSLAANIQLIINKSI